jgi:hypothetical protein
LPRKLRQSLEVAWIPEALATTRKYLRVRDDDGWQVVEVSSVRQNGEYLHGHERDRPDGLPLLYLRRYVYFHRSAW